jgi:hypothetical protein
MQKHGLGVDINLEESSKKMYKVLNASVHGEISRIVAVPAGLNLIEFYFKKWYSKGI